MKKPKHTEGPWSNDMGIIEFGAINIAMVTQADEYHYETKRERVKAETECEANGYLIAAAPDMYAAIAAYLDAIDHPQAAMLGEGKEADAVAAMRRALDRAQIPVNTVVKAEAAA